MKTDPSDSSRPDREKKNGLSDKNDGTKKARRFRRESEISFGCQPEIAFFKCYLFIFLNVFISTESFLSMKRGFEARVHEEAHGTFEMIYARSLINELKSIHLISSTNSSI